MGPDFGKERRSAAAMGGNASFIIISVHSGDIDIDSEGRVRSFDWLSGGKWGVRGRRIRSMLQGDHLSSNP